MLRTTREFLEKKKSTLIYNERPETEGRFFFLSISHRKVKYSTSIPIRYYSFEKLQTNKAIIIDFDGIACNFWNFFYFHLRF